MAFLHPLCFKPPAVSTVGSPRDISKPSTEGRVQRQNFWFWKRLPYFFCAGCFTDIISLAPLNKTFLINKKTEAQRDSVIYPRPHSQEGAEPEVQARGTWHHSPTRSVRQTMWSGTLVLALQRGPRRGPWTSVSISSFVKMISVPSFTPKIPSEMSNLLENPQIVCA